MYCAELIFYHYTGYSPAFSSVPRCFSTFLYKAHFWRATGHNDLILCDSFSGLVRNKLIGCIPEKENDLDDFIRYVPEKENVSDDFIGCIPEKENVSDEVIRFVQEKENASDEVIGCIREKENGSDDFIGTILLKENDSGKVIGVILEKGNECDKLFCLNQAIKTGRKYTGVINAGNRFFYFKNLPTKPIAAN